jgi:integrase
MTPLRDHLQQYLTIRRSLGFHLSTTERILRRFVTFAESESADYVDTALFVRWQERYGSAGRQTWAARLGIVRLFAQWLNGIDPRNEVPPRGLIPGQSRRPHPHIYSDEEIRRILNAAAELPSVYGMRGLTYSTLIGLIAVTGLRVSEATALNNNDLDVEAGVITVRCGKSGKQRLVPISDSALARLRAYAKERDRLLGRTPEPLFISERGTRPKDCSVEYNFASACQKIGLRPVQPENRHGRGPRIHDLRHTFAARTLLNWYRQGLDPNREMIKLSTYLGHSNPKHTYWYIEAVPELLELASERVSRSVEREDRP